MFRGAVGMGGAKATGGLRLGGDNARSGERVQALRELLPAGKAQDTPRYEDGPDGA